MGRELFTKDMKLADLINANYKLLYVLPRFGIKLNLGDATVDQIANARSVSTPLLLTVCNIYTFENFSPDTETLRKISLKNLISYLKNSHVDYRESRLPQISQKVLEMVSQGDIKHGKILKQFFENYEQELNVHFEYEEKILFPYINSLLYGDKDLNFSINQFEKNHGDIEEKLDDMKNILIKYLPEENFSNQCRETLFDLFLLEEDLNRHTLIEDKILVSLVERMENKRK